jgi:hypothetical protein
MAEKGIPTQGVALAHAYPAFIELILSQRAKELSDKIASQLPKVHVPSQILDGTPRNFQFMAYPLPRLSYEERQKHVLFSEETITISGSNWTVSLDIDLFGRINWFYIEGIPELYHALEPHLPMGE